MNVHSYSISVVFLPAEYKSVSKNWLACQWKNGKYKESMDTILVFYCCLDSVKTHFLEKKKFFKLSFKLSVSIKNLFYGSYISTKLQLYFPNLLNSYLT